MKKMITLCFFLLISTLYSQPAWEYVDAPNDSRVNDFVSDYEGNLYACSQGIYKSTDGGDSWNSCSMLTVDGKSFDGFSLYSFNKLLHINGVLLCVAYRNAINYLFRSTDMGSSWLEVENLPPSDQMQIYKDQKDNLYLCNRNGLSNSIDEGKSWNLIKGNTVFLTGTIHDMGSDNLGNIYIPRNETVYIYNLNSNIWSSAHFTVGESNHVSKIEVIDDIVYAASDSGLYVSKNSGTDWSRVDFLGNSNIDGLNIFGQNIYLINWVRENYKKYTANLFVSKDKGEVFTKMPWPNSAPYFNKIFEANNKIYLIGSGVYLWDDLNEIWIKKNTGLDYPAIRRLLINSKDDYHAFSVVNYSFKSKKNNVWETKGQPGNTIWPVTGAGCDSKDKVYFFNLQEPGYNSTDNGDTWILNDSVLQFVMNFVITKTGRLVATSAYGFFYSDDEGKTWLKKSNILGAVVSKYTSDGIFIISEFASWWPDPNIDNTYKMSSDNGESWVRLDIIKSYCPESYLSDYDIVLEDNNKRFIFATEGGIYNSMDLMNYIPANGIGCINTTMMKRYGDLFFAATDSGIYRSEDLGLNWSKFNNGIPVAKTTLQGVDSQGRLYISTIKGVYRTINSVTGVEEPKLESSDYLIYPNPVTDGVVRIKTKADYSSIQLLDIYGNVIQTYDGKERELVLNNVSSGAYFIRFIGSRGITTQKIVVLSTN